jgi:predicted Rossmann-fold nucleotide-binding protein
MPGGIGTLAEVSFAWQELLLNIVPPRPLVLVGARWRALYDSFVANLVQTPNLYDVLTLAATPADAAEFLRGYFGLERGAGAKP